MQINAVVKNDLLKILNSILDNEGFDTENREIDLPDSTEEIWSVYAEMTVSDVTSREFVCETDIMLHFIENQIFDIDSTYDWMHSSKLDEWYDSYLPDVETTFRHGVLDYFINNKDAMADFKISDFADLFNNAEFSMTTNLKHVVAALQSSLAEYVSDNVRGLTLDDLIENEDARNEFLSVDPNYLVVEPTIIELDVLSYVDDDLIANAVMNGDGSLDSIEKINEHAINIKKESGLSNYQAVLLALRDLRSTLQNDVNFIKLVADSVGAPIIEIKRGFLFNSALM